MLIFYYIIFKIKDYVILKKKIKVIMSFTNYIGLHLIHQVNVIMSRKLPRWLILNLN
jgi:hypothetical protein